MAEAEQRAETASRANGRGPARPRRPAKPTINDVAAAAGVSRGTVSRALNGSHYVSALARARVEKAMRKIGYVANQSARTLATGRADAIAFVLSEPQERLFEDPNFHVLLRASTQALAERDIGLVLMLAGGQRQRIVRFIRARHVDGVMLISSHQGDRVQSELTSMGIPTVACGKPLGHETQIPYVSANDRAGAQLMTRYLLTSGRKRVGLITGPVDTPGGIDRLQGYRDVMGSRFRRQRVVSAAEYSYAAGEDAMRRLLDQSPDVDAVFAASDLLAAGALMHLIEVGLSVPQDIAVGGFDDSQLATTTRPQLTTIRQPLETIAHELVEVLLARIEGREVSSRVLPVSLVRRQSA